MFTTPKLKICLCLTLLFAFTASMAIAGSPEWAWDQGSYEQDGTVTMDGEDYSINPTGHQSLTGKSVRQPPTVIVQSTPSGGGGAIFYTPSVQGNFGGDVYCEATFGPGYVMANIGEIYAYTNVGMAMAFWWPEMMFNYCDNYTSNSNTVYGGWAQVQPGSTGALHTNSMSVTCNHSYPVACVKR